MKKAVRQPDDDPIAKHGLPNMIGKPRPWPPRGSEGPMLTWAKRRRLVDLVPHRMPHHPRNPYVGHGARALAAAWQEGYDACHKKWRRASAAIQREIKSIKADISAIRNAVTRRS